MVESSNNRPIFRLESSDGGVDGNDDSRGFTMKIYRYQSPIGLFLR